MAAHDALTPADRVPSNQQRDSSHKEPPTAPASILETLPTELAVSIADNLDNADKTSLALASRSMARRLGGVKLEEQASQRTSIGSEAHEHIAQELEKRVTYNSDGATIQFMEPALRSRRFASAASRDRFDNALLASENDLERMKSIAALTSSRDLEDSGRKRYIEHCFTHLRTQPIYGQAEVLAASAIMVSVMNGKPLAKEHAKELDVIFEVRDRDFHRKPFGKQFSNSVRDAALQQYSSAVEQLSVSATMDVAKAVTTLSDIKVKTPKTAEMAAQRLSDLTELGKISRSHLFAERDGSPRGR